MEYISHIKVLKGNGRRYTSVFPLTSVKLRIILWLEFACLSVELKISHPYTRMLKNDCIRSIPNNNFVEFLNKNMGSALAKLSKYLPRGYILVCGEKVDKTVSGYFL